MGTAGVTIAVVLRWGPRNLSWPGTQCVDHASLKCRDTVSLVSALKV